MTQSLAQHLQSLGLTLPAAAPAVGNYVPRLRVGSMLYISGQLPVLEGKPQYIGPVHALDDRRHQGERRKNKTIPQGNSSSFTPRRQDRRQVSSAVFGVDAIKAAEICALNILAQLAAEVHDDMTQVDRVVRLGGFVSSAAGFMDHAKIINGASDLMVKVFGNEKGTHVRAATGASSLPLNVTVEIEATFALK